MHESDSSTVGCKITNWVISVRKLWLCYISDLFYCAVQNRRARTVNVLPKRKGLAALCGRNTEPASEGSAVGTVPKDTSELPLGSLHVEENLEVKAKCGRTQCISVYDGKTDRRTSFVFV